MNQTTSLLTLLCSDYDKFFEAEKKIADYIIANKKAALDMTIAELAKASDTSDATVSRFCKKLGLKNYQTFRLALAKDVMEEQQQSLSTSNDISLDNVNQSLQNILANKVAELTSTVSMIEADNLTAIIRCLDSADIIKEADEGKTERLSSYPDAGGGAASHLHLRHLQTADPAGAGRQGQPRHRCADNQRQGITTGQAVQLSPPHRPKGAPAHR